MTDWIRVEDIKCECIIGITEEEQRSLQPLLIDVAMVVDLDPSAEGDLTLSVDYAAVCDAARFLAEYGRWFLIESLATAIARYVLAPPPPAAHRAAVELVKVRLRKPTILKDAVPSVELERTAEWADLKTRSVPDKAWVDTLCVTKRLGAYRVHLEPGRAWRVPSDAALLVTDGTVNGGTVDFSPGDRLAWGQVTELRGSSPQPATVLVVCSPIP